ncbi:hypothetical protein HRbin02_01942 [Candidatus Calditenuaceae archaeon HR02]|nr:hypothetical protein HRbin02_01942 [Candidatus Calditenuaceae archaeon HR02]
MLEGLAIEGRMLGIVGYLLIGLGLALEVIYLLIFFRPPSEVWRPLQVRLLILASVTGVTAFIAWVGLALLQQSRKTS